MGARSSNTNRDGSRSQSQNRLLNGHVANFFNSRLDAGNIGPNQKVAIEASGGNVEFELDGYSQLGILYFPFFNFLFCGVFFAETAVLFFITFFLDSDSEIFFSLSCSFLTSSILSWAFLKLNISWYRL